MREIPDQRWENDIDKPIGIIDECCNGRRSKDEINEVDPHTEEREEEAQYEQGSTDRPNKRYGRPKCYPNGLAYETYEIACQPPRSTCEPVNRSPARWENTSHDGDRQYGEDCRKPMGISPTTGPDKPVPKLEPKPWKELINHHIPIENDHSLSLRSVGKTTLGRDRINDLYTYTAYVRVRFRED